MTREFLVGAVLLLLALARNTEAATPADSALARTYLRQAAAYCLQNNSDTLDANRPTGNRAATLTPADWDAVNRRNNLPEVIELQWRYGDSLEATRNAREIIDWGRRHHQLGYLLESGSGLIRRLQAAHSDLAVRILMDWAAERPNTAPDTPDLDKTDAAEALGRSIGVDRALQYLKRTVPDSVYQQSLPRLAFSWADVVEDVPTIVRLSEMLPRPDYRSSLLVNFADKRCEAHDWQTALAVIDLIPDSAEGKRHLLASISDEMVKHGGNSQLALSLADKALKIDGGIRSMSCRPVVARVFLALGRTDRVNALLRDAPECDRPDILCEISLHLAVAGAPDSAVAVLARAAQPAPCIHLDLPLGLWLSAVADSGLFDVAFRALDSLPRGYVSGSAYSVVATAQARHGLTAATEATLDSVHHDPYGMSMALAALATAYARAGDLISAFRTVDRIEPAVVAQGNPGEFGLILVEARLDALRAIGATPAGRAKIESILDERTPFDATSLLIGAARGVMSQ